MKKLSAYQKLKLRVAELEHDLNEVVLNPDSFDSKIIKLDITFNHEMGKQLFMGEKANYTTKGLMHWGREKESINSGKSTLEMLEETKANINSSPNTVMIMSGLRDKNAKLLNTLYLESRSSDSTNAHKTPSFEQYERIKDKITDNFLPSGSITLEPLFSETKPIEGVKYALGSLILECIRVAPYCQDCYLKPLCDAGKFSNNYCKILKVGEDKTPYTLGFMRYCSAYIEKNEQVTDKTE